MRFRDGIQEFGKIKKLSDKYLKPFMENNKTYKRNNFRLKKVMQ